MGTPSDARLSSEMNWRSVAFNASSDMLLMSPIVMCPVDRLWPGSLSKKTGIRFSLRCYQGGGCVECLLQIVKDVVDVLDPDAEADHLRYDTCVALLFGGHLAMSGRRRVAGQRLGVAQIDQPLD